MQKKLIFSTLAGLLAIAATFPAWTGAMPLQPTGQFISLAHYPGNASTFMAASENSIFLHENHRWSKIPTNTIRNIKKIVSIASLPDAFFILTDTSVYQHKVSSQLTEKIYTHSSESGFSVLSFTVLPDDPDHFFVGTSSGLYESDNAGKRWFPFEYFKTWPIHLLVFESERLYLATDTQLYISDDLNRFHSVFSLPYTEIDNDSLIENESSRLTPRINAISSSEDGLWIATDRGVFREDYPRHWAHLSETGLRSQNVLFISYQSTRHLLFAGTSEGVYQYSFDRSTWERKNQHFDAQPLVGMTFSSEKGVLIALTESSLFEIEAASPSVTFAYEPDPARLEQLQMLIKLEPTVQEIQKHTISANDLSQGKINRWHVASRLSAILPSLSFGKDLSRSASIDIDRAGTNDPDRYISGPEDISRGWDFDVSWDLGDFIFSTAQTSIDSRSKLNSEARRDFLSEAARLYFERRRLQMEIIYAPSPSPLQHQERLLHMDELTALLDSLTKEFFSRRLRKIYTIHPELETLWIFQSVGHPA